MKEFRNKLIVHGLMKINDKYLVIKRSIIKRGKPNVYPEYWDIPGGSVEDFETPGEALIREVKEEVNLDVEVKQIIHEDSNFDKGKNTMFTRLVYICTLKNTTDYTIQLDKGYFMFALSVLFENEKKKADGGVIKTITKETLTKFLIPIPSLEEQTKIASILSSVDNQIEEYQNKKSKLEELKKGLMQQLLTGKIRVKVDSDIYALVNQEVCENI